MGRANLRVMELLLDELAAREIAEQRGIPIVGFARILFRACQQGLIGPGEVRDALLVCRRQGTRYALVFIEQIYNRLRRS